MLLTVGKFAVALAISEGLGGPAQAIMSTNSVYATILAIFIDG
jgi:hypothetical protein